MKIPAAGELREQLKFQSLARAADGQGGTTPTWGDVATVWAKIEPLSQGQVDFSEQLQDRKTHRVWIRTGAVTGLTSEMRISFVDESRVFQIRGFRDLGERDRFTEVSVEEGVPS